MNGIEVIAEGVTFENVRNLLHALYFYYEDMPATELERTLKYIVPMQHNFMNPLAKRDSDDVDDTWIEYWVVEDGQVTQSATRHAYFADEETDGQTATYSTVDQAYKLAAIKVRFLGKRAEAWAKMMHHLTKRVSAGTVFADVCNAERLEYVSPIRPINVDYFGAQNTTVAYDITMKLWYKEVIKTPSNRLKYISLAEGIVE